MRPAITLGLLAFFLVTPEKASAYYHYIHYTSNTAPYGPVPEKFDLSVLPNKTVTFFASSTGPIAFSENDSFPSALNQIRRAAAAWNAVGTSDLRVAFGGLYTPGTVQNAPGGEVVFEEMPPGLLAFGGPTSPTSPPEVSSGAGGPFVPITRAVIHLNQDLTKRPGPSYLESFYMTLVHEMGHALGLQHTFTSATMSTALTRATNQVRPLDSDDIAGLSVLYPKPEFASQYGSISGTVTSGGQGVHLASVVALPPTGPAISAVTNPDGTYRIDGLAPAAAYWIYVHALPPTADMVLPLDPSGQPVQASPPIATRFFSPDHTGTAYVQTSPTISTMAGSTVTGIDFSVPTRGSVPIYDVSTYSYYGSNAVSPAFVNSTVRTATIVARGAGLTTEGDNPSPTPGLAVQVLGGFGPAAVRTYGVAGTLALDLAIPPFAGTGPRHLLFSAGNDLYVLPAALQLVQKQPPALSGITANPDGTATVFGSGLGPGSRIFFDSQRASVEVPFSGDDHLGAITVQPPPGAPDQRATLTIVNPDGQNSTFTQTGAAITYDYGPAAPPLVTISPSSLPAGGTAMVDIAGINTHFADGQTTIGFGTSDISVERVWVLSPTHAMANVRVSPGAALNASAETAISGFQVYSQPLAFQVQPARSDLPVVYVPPVNATPGETAVYPGAVVSIFGANLALDANSASVTVSEKAATILFASSGQINFQIPTGLGSGPAVLKVNNGAATSFPVLVQIDPAPPVIVAVTAADNTSIGESRPARPGEMLTALVAGAGSTAAQMPERVRVLQGSASASVVAVLPAPQGGLLQVQFFVSGAATGPQVPLQISVDNRLSRSLPIPILAPQP